ncbi:MAG: hypothetical protein HY784_18360 [Chloroflexi bacterium]|nr:hypothetical protein [Chloroflexota bacterium]
MESGVLLQLIREGEGQRIEFKLESEKQVDLAESARRGTLDYERTPVSQATLDDLSEQKVRGFLAQRLRTSIPDRPLDRLLQDMGAATVEAGVWRPTIGGLLFFGNWPQFYLSHATILAARLVGPRGVQIVDRATIEGTLPEAIDRAVQFVRRNTRHGVQIGSEATARARDVDEYPAESVREAITNACCHRDYLERAPIQLKIHDDRLVVGNPGGLLPGLDIAHLEGKHRARNPLLADWLHALGYVERFGLGITRMREAMREAELPDPQFHSTPDWFEVILRGPGQSIMPGRASREASPSPDGPPPSLSGSEPAPGQPWYAQVWSSHAVRAARP